MVKDRIKLDLSFDPKQLQADLQQLESIDWIAHFVKQNYQGDWSVLPLRGSAGETHPIRMIYSDPSCTEFSDTPFLAQCPYFANVLNTFNCPLLAVRLMKLTPNSIIKEHSDHDLSAECGTVRLHIPVTTNDAVDFRLNGEQVVMNSGECWYLRLSDPHSVQNNGTSDRVHLVIDATMNDWLSQKLFN